MPTCARPRQHGFVLLALVALLLAGASAASLFARPDRAHAPGLRTSADARRLAAAREALLAYTASYPELYGPTGAGPGRLPCPDTDGGFRLAGPNPPCGRGGGATGKLPEHVTVADARVGLDPRNGRAPIRYRLDARAANNPPDRTLVAAWRSGALAGRTAMATLSLGEGGPLLHLRADALMRAAERRVAAWAASHAAEPPPGGPRVDVLALVTRPVPAPTGEGEPVPLVEGVPRSRHWFVADGWADAFEAVVEPACAQALAKAARECRWRTDGRVRTAAERSNAAGRPRIRLTFAPTHLAPAPGVAAP